MLSHLRPALVLLVLFSALTGLVYPLAITGIAQVALKTAADGTVLIGANGNVVGSSLIGQNFTSDRYFHGRPSATSAPDPNDASKTVDAPYNAANSSGSNLGPTSQKLVDRVKGDVEALGGSPANSVPADAVTTSASGFDPHISPAFARLQIARVAKARSLTEAAVGAAVDAHTETPALGFIGEPRINVLALNMDLDRTAAR